MKIAIISDIHGNLEALKAVIHDIQMRDKFDHVICLGDIVGYYANPLECINKVKKFCDIVIQGNHDSAVTTTNFEKRIKWFNKTAARSLQWTRAILLKESNEEQFNFLKKLKIKKTLFFNGKNFLFVHGTPDDKWEYFLYPYWNNKPLEEQRIRLDEWLKNWNFVAMGHSHWAFQYERNNRYVINPGSVGQPRDENPDASYSIVEVSETQLKVRNFRVIYEIEKTCAALKSANLDEYLCARLHLGH